MSGLFGIVGFWVCVCLWLVLCVFVCVNVGAFVGVLCVLAFFFVAVFVCAVRLGVGMARLG